MLVFECINMSFDISETLIGQKCVKVTSSGDKQNRTLKI